MPIWLQRQPCQQAASPSPARRRCATRHAAARMGWEAADQSGHPRARGWRTQIKPSMQVTSLVPAALLTKRAPPARPAAPANKQVRLSTGTEATHGMHGLTVAEVVGLAPLAVGGGGHRAPPGRCRGAGTGAQGRAGECAARWGRCVRRVHGRNQGPRRVTLGRWALYRNVIARQHLYNLRGLNARSS